ncbi:MAG: hypothetical protein ACXW1U_16715 [Methylobacter sp.]
MKLVKSNKGAVLGKPSTESPSYQVDWLAALLASHSNYDSFASADDGVLLNSGKSQQRISYLSIGKGIALEPGFFWDVLAIHLENGEVIRVGGISKKQSHRLQTGLNRAAGHFLTNFYQHIVPEIQSASRQARILFSGNRYIRKAVARQWLQNYESLAKGTQRKDIRRFLPAEAVQDLEFIRPLMHHGHDALNIPYALIPNRPANGAAAACEKGADTGFARTSAAITSSRFAQNAAARCP